MRFLVIVCGFLVNLLLNPSSAYVVSSPVFCYNEEKCDQKVWGKISGSCQPNIGSPINLGAKMKRNVSLTSLGLHGYDNVTSSSLMIANTRDSVVVEFPEGMYIDGANLPGKYITKEVRFHWGSPYSNGSEHTLNGRRFPMEMQIRSFDVRYMNLTNAQRFKSGLCHITVFIDWQVGPNSNKDFDIISSKIHLVSHPDKSSHLEAFPLINLMPRDNLSQFYHYQGGVTTPPCDQTVEWIVMEVPIYISEPQYTMFTTGVYYSDEGDKRQKPLQNNYRLVNTHAPPVVTASRDATIPTSSAVPVLGTVHCLLCALILSLA